MPVTLQPTTLKYKDGQTFVSADCLKGDPGSPGDPTQLIDDTAGSGDTDKTWSADKLTSKADVANPVFTGSISLGRVENTTVGEKSTATGTLVTASGPNSHAGGYGTTASGSCSSAEGSQTFAVGDYSHSQGYGTRANGDASSVEGNGTVANGANSSVSGMYNVPDSYANWSDWAPNTDYAAGDKVHIPDEEPSDPRGEYFVCNTSHTSGTAWITYSFYWDSDNGKMNYAQIVGNGSNYLQQSNAYTLDWAGNGSYAGDVTINKGTVDEVSVSALKTEINSKVDEDDLHDILYDFVSESHYEDVTLSQIDGYNIYQHVPSTSKVQLAEQSSTYRAYNSIAVTPGEQYRITIKNFKSTYSRCFYVIDGNDTFVYAPENTASDTTESIDFTIPSGGVAILINKKGSTPTPELKKLVTTGEWKPREILSVKDPVYFEESDGTYYVRCEKDNTTDFVHAFDFNANNSNPCLSFKYLKTIPHSTKDEDTITAFGSGSNYKGVNDDRCPLHLNGYYIGAGHGNPNYIKVTASNDKTEKDIGSIWSDGTNNFTIIEVGTVDFIIGCLQNNEVASVTLGSTLTHVSGATHTSSVTVTDSETIQLRPCGNMFTHEIYGNKEIPAVSGRRYGEIRVVEKYNILRSDAIFSFLQANVGSNTNESYFDDAITSEMAVVENVYVFSRNGSITIYSAVEFKSSVDFDYFGVSQAIALANSGNVGFVPDSSTLATPTTITGKTYFSWTGDVIPYRFYQMLSDYSKGFGIIYETSAGYGNPTKRAGVCSESGSFANSSWKMYPHLFSPSVSEVNNGDYFSAIAARMPIQTSATMPTLCWYWVDDKVVLACDVASAFDGFIPLPEYLINKKITPRDLTEGLTVQNDFVTQKGIRLKNTTNAIAHLVAELV